MVWTILVSAVVSIIVCLGFLIEVRRWLENRVDEFFDKELEEIKKLIDKL